RSWKRAGASNQQLREIHRCAPSPGAPGRRPALCASSRPPRLLRRPLLAYPVASEACRTRAAMTDEKNPLLLAVEDGVALLTLNRPEKLNALSRPMIEQAVAALERCAADPAIGCVVVTGAGRGFCAGGDIDAMKADA